MKVSWYRSATVGIFSKSGTSILCDPWITDGAFIGSWFHWPPLQGFEFQELLNYDWDALYVSHLHADHFDRKFIASLVRKKPDIKVIIPNFAHPWLMRAIMNCGIAKDKIIQVKNGQSLQIKDIQVQVLTADACNPDLCGVNVPCHQSNYKLSTIDSLAIFSADGKRVLNANDSLAVASVPRVLRSIGSVDLILGHYGGAGPYPQCFDGLNVNEKIRESTKVASTFVRRLATASEVTKAKFVFPYAGQYLLGGRLSELNDFRSVLSTSKTIEMLQNSTISKPISLAPFGEFNLCTEEIDFTFIEPSSSQKLEYLEKISKELFPYEKKEEIWDDFENNMKKAAERVVQIFNNDPYSNGTLADSSYILSDNENNSITINFIGSNSSVITGNNPHSENVTTIQTDSRLWRRLITRRTGYHGFTQYHFNQAEIGSHLKWKRIGSFHPEVRYLDFLQT